MYKVRILGDIMKYKYEIMKNPYQHDGQALVNAIIDVCQSTDKDCLYYNSPCYKVYEQLTKLCFDIRFNIISKDYTDVIYMNDFHIENKLKYLCETYGYYNIICNVNISDEYDYWYFIREDWNAGVYHDINDMCSFLLPQNDYLFNEQYNRWSRQIAERVQYRWDYIDFDYDEYNNNNKD